MKIVVAYFFLLLSIVWLFSCSNAKYGDFQKTETGLQYKFHQQNPNAVHPVYGQVVLLKMVKRMGDSILETSDTYSPNGIDQMLRTPTFKGAIEEGLLMMSEGDSATFLINTDSINKYFPANNPAQNFKPNDVLALDIKMLKIKSIEEAKQEEYQKRVEFIRQRKQKGPQELAQYLEGNHIDVKPTASGLYYMEKEKGKGISPKIGDSVIVHYVGGFLNGTIFDSSVERNQPFGFEVGSKIIIPGWDEGVKRMKKGAVATLILPPSLAYDSAGFINPKTGKYFIPPYTPLKFDIQLLEIITNK